MASILETYGIKEVADVTFYTINPNGAIGVPVLYLDTLKVSTVEQTAENTSARGGKGNPELVSWDYGKEITVTLEDALFSAKSMAIMYGAVDIYGNAVYTSVGTVKKTAKKEQVTLSNSEYYVNVAGIPTKLENVSFYDEVGNTSSVSYSNCAYVTGDIEVADGTGMMLEISSATFPGTYYITGDTFARSAATGRDELFQFVIPKAKVSSDVTLTLEAEGDPSTFSMTLRVLRPENGPMMQLIKYAVA